MSQKSADYLEGYGDPIPQNDFILVEIRDKKEDLTASGLVKSATAEIKPYVIVVKISEKVVKAGDLDIQVGDIIEMVDVRNLLMFEGADGQHLALVDRKHVGAIYRKDPNYVPRPKTVRKLKADSLSAPERPPIQIVGADERDFL